MFRDALFPFIFNHWNILNKANDVVFHGVKLTRNFGPWHDKEFCHSMQILFSEGKIRELKMDGTLMREIEFDIVPRAANAAPVAEPPGRPDNELDPIYL